MATEAAGVTVHAGHGPAVVIGSEPRCTGCGHRLTVNGRPPVQTRELPASTWPAELIGRRRARLVGKWTGLTATSGRGASDGE